MHTLLDFKYNKRMKRDLYLKVIIGIGIWIAVVTIFGVWEYNILQAEMVLNDKLLSHDRIVQTQAPLAGGKVAYVVEMLFWTVFILALGYIWSKILFPHRNLLEKVVFSFVLGIFIMPITIFIPFTAITIATVFSTLIGATPPEFIGPTLNNIVGMFVNGHEQIYEFMNVFVLLTIGLVILGIKQFSRKSYSNSKAVPLA